MKICVFYLTNLRLWEISVFECGKEPKIIQYCITKSEAQSFIRRWLSEAAGEIELDHRCRNFLVED